MNSQFGHDGPTRSEKEKPIVALWTPGWFSLDPCLKIGEASTFSFYQKPPSTTKIPNEAEFVFFNGLESEAETLTFDTTILSIAHPVLGEIREVNTDELDYAFTLACGEIVEVNAEEDPGSIVQGNFDVTSWDLTVYLYGLTPAEPPQFY